MTNESKTKTLVKPRVHHKVVKKLAQMILSREFEPGTYFPPEPDLCTQLKVSRSALREAVKVLGSKGMVVTRPRTGTMIQPRDDWNLLDADLLTWSIDLEPSADLVLSLIEARQVIEPAAARFAALRATPEDIARMDNAFNQMSEAKDLKDFTTFNEADIEFHSALLRASHNIVFKQLSNTIGAALAYSFRITTQRARDPGASLPNHGEVIERIRARDSEGAYDSMARLLNIAVVDLGLTQFQDPK
ncbi:MAG: FadR family transcriptional regulator [Hyphomicrobiales bacterium]